MTGLSWYLQNFLTYSVQLAVMIGTAALLVKFLPIGVPRLSYAYWRVLLLACLLLPLIQPWPAPVQTPSGPPVLFPIEELVTPQFAASAATDAPWRIPYVPILIGMLAAGIVVRASRFLVGGLRLRRMLGQARPADFPASWKVTIALRGAQPRIRFLDAVTGPATYGFRQPIILLPPKFSDLTERQQQAVIYHELRHIERRDWLFRLAEETVRCLFWFHPLVLWLTRRIELTREQTVDQEVLGMLGESKPYLESLMEMAQARIRGSVAAVFLTESYLSQRVRLIKEGLTMSKRRLGFSLALTLVVLVSVGGLAVWAFPLQAQGQEAAPAGLPGGNRAESQKRGPETDSQTNTGLAPVRVGGNVMTSKLTHWVPPEYPEDAKNAGIRGMVIVKVTVSEAGDVSQVEEVRGHPMLVEAAIAAVRQWKYSPTLLNGQAVPVIATQTLTFPPGNGPELSSGVRPVSDPETLNLFLDEAGSLWGGGKCLEGSDLAQALQGKRVVILTTSSASLPSPSVIEKTVKMLESFGVRVQVSNVQERGQEMRSLIELLQPLREAGGSLGYGWFRWSFIEDGRRGAEFRAITTNLGSTSLLEEPGPDSSWAVTITCQILRDADQRITAVNHVGGPSVPEIDQAVSTMVGKALRRYSQPASLELEISFK